MADRLILQTHLAEVISYKAAGQRFGCGNSYENLMV